MNNKPCECRDGYDTCRQCAAKLRVLTHGELHGQESTGTMRMRLADSRLREKWYRDIFDRAKRVIEMGYGIKAAIYDDDPKSDTRIMVELVHHEEDTESFEAYGNTIEDAMEQALRAALKEPA